jgi:hypothetical protein
MVVGLLAPAQTPAPSNVPPCNRPVLPADAARRAAALGFISSRAWLEMTLPKVTKREDLKELQRRRTALLKRADDMQLGTVLTPDEFALLRKDLGAWEKSQVNLGSWAMEGAGTLLWTLGVQATLPPLAGPMTMDQALRPIMPTGAAEALQKKPRLRPSDELARSWGEAQLYAWRFSVEEDRRKAGGTSKDALPASIRDPLKAALAARLTTHAADGELLAGSTPVPRLSNQQLGTLTGAARARSDALRWVCGER